MKEPKGRDIIRKFKKISSSKTNETEKEIKKSFNAFKKQNKNKVDIRLSDAIDELFLDEEEYIDDMELNY